jgi:hypothetical protein
VATAARSLSPSGGSGKADGQDRRGGPPHRSLPNAGVIYREHPADVGPFLEAADQLQVRKGDRGREGTEYTRDYRALEKYT